MTYCQRYNSNTFLLTHSSDIPITPDWFTHSFWSEEEIQHGDVSGRGPVFFFNNSYGQFVVRTYRRGGLIQKVSRTAFLYLGVKRSRPFRELALLSYMQEKRLPVPIPVAALCDKQGLYYEASIITALIPDSIELYQLMLPENESNKVWPKINWQAVGSIIRRFHDTGIDHTDLNCHNIMLDINNKIWLIDFDKCRQRSPNKKWQQANLLRLKRSLEKERNKNTNFLYQDSNWENLLEGYYV